MVKRLQSRLTRRQQTKTVTVYQRNSAGVESAVSAALTGIAVTHHEKLTNEFVAEFGAVVSKVTDIFWFYPISGSLPTLTEQHVVYEDGDTTTQYEVVSAVDQGGQGEVLMVATNRVRL
jgi:hypothetical protein